MKKIICILGSVLLLTGCIAIPGNLASDVLNLSDNVKAMSYSVRGSSITFNYFNPEKNMLDSRRSNYLIQKDKKDDFIAFVASEHDERNCFIGLTITQKNFDSNIDKLQQFISWSRLSLTERTKNQESITAALKSLQSNLAVTNQSDDDKPLLTYSGKNCDFFSSEKYYAVSPNSIEKIIATATEWKNNITTKGEIK